MNAEAGWPINVRPISLEDLENLGIGHDGTLYWAGRPMVMQQRSILTWRQTFVASLVVVVAILGGVTGSTLVLSGGGGSACGWVRPVQTTP
ncbi:hypothetical protein [Lichenifustis flavocetrariae]|uniref:Uncharacterized protein n=1 Tax=Lichenifustis flavocetrariae TaxID=2949735 RepID=A0AA41YZ03_9HYPH|nr:hypothetical protein [Lichenifustis flavocetrariae]MCW6510719.1 hypothetical protein [Lichenifustis flavocetrariae]